MTFRLRESGRSPPGRLGAALIVILLHAVLLGAVWVHRRERPPPPVEAPPILLTLVEPVVPRQSQPTPRPPPPAKIRHPKAHVPPRPVFTAAAPESAQATLMTPVPQAISAAPEPAPAPAAPQKAAPVDYAALLAARLAGVKHYPVTALQSREQGTVLVSFQLDRSGRMLAWHIARGSGFAALDREVARMVVAAAPFPPFPASLEKSVETFVVPIEFSLDH